MRRLKQTLRAGEWWQSQPPVMMAVAYWALLVNHRAVPALAALGSAALFITATFGMAAIGFLVNDIGDRDADAAAGKRNAAATLGTRSTYTLLAGVVVLAVVPWIWLHPRPETIALLGGELLLFAIYALPPVRLKTRGFAGPLADAAYAYTIPVLVTVFVFGGLHHNHPQALQLVLAPAWAEAIGLRQYIAHLLDDAGEDERAGDRTFVLEYGWWRSFRLLAYVIFPLELVLMAAVLVVIAFHSPVPLIGLPVWVWVWYQRDRPFHVLGSRVWQVSAVARQGVFADRIVSTFLVAWLPLLLLVALVVRRPAYAGLLVLHLLAFPRQLRAARRWVWYRLTVAA